MLGRHDPPLSVECSWDDRRATVVVRGEVDFATVGILAKQLDEVAGQQLPVRVSVRTGEVGGELAEAVVEQPDQRLPGAVVAVVRGGGE